MIPIPILTILQRKSHAHIIFRRSQAINAGYTGYNDHISPFKEGTGGGMAQTVDLVVDRGVLFYIGVAGGHICLRLVIVVIADKIVHCVMGEELPELTAQLRGQCFVMGQNQGGLLHGLHHFGHGIRLAGTGHAKEGLVLHTRLNSSD